MVCRVRSSGRVRCGTATTSTTTTTVASRASRFAICRRLASSVTYLLLGRVALAAQRPIVIKLARGRSVGRCVGLSSALWKNGGSDPFGIVGQTGAGMRQVVGFGDRSTERGTFGGEFGRAIVTNGDFTRTCATVPRRGPLLKLVWANLF